MKGHVFKRGTKWFYKFDGSADPLTGKRRQVAKGGFDSEREACAACRDAIKALESGRHVRSSRRKLGAYLTDEWLAAMRHVIKPTTFASYEDYARAYVVPVLGNVRLQDQLTATRLNAFYDHLMTTGRVKREGGLSPEDRPERARHDPEGAGRCRRVGLPPVQSGRARATAPNPETAAGGVDARRGCSLPHRGEGRPVLRALPPGGDDRHAAG